MVEKKVPPGTITITPGTNPEPYTSIVNAGPFNVGNGDTESMIIGASVEDAWVPQRVAGVPQARITSMRLPTLKCPKPQQRGTYKQSDG